MNLASQAMRAEVKKALGKLERDRRILRGVLWKVLRVPWWQINYKLQGTQLVGVVDGLVFGVFGRGLHVFQRWEISRPHRWSPYRVNLPDNQAWAHVEDKGSLLWVDPVPGTLEMFMDPDGERLAWERYHERMDGFRVEVTGSGAYFLRPDPPPAPEGEVEQR